MKSLTPLLLILFVCSAFAGPLDRGAVEKWLEAFPKMDDWMKMHEDEMEEGIEAMESDSLDPEKLRDLGVEILKKHGKYEAFANVANSLGYDPAEKFIEDTARITRTMVAISVREEMGKVSTEDLEQQLKMIDTNDALSAEQKTMISDRIRESIAQIKGFMGQMESVEDADIEAVKPYMEQIQSLFRRRSNVE